MAQRKRPETHPQLQGGVSDYSKPSKALRPENLNSTVRMIRTAGLDRVEQVRIAVERNMKRLGVKVGRTKPVEETPDGSDQVDVMSMVVWADSIESNDRKAKRQLAKLAATLGVRQR